jgi:hypothetical protein
MLFRYLQTGKRKKKKEKKTNLALLLTLLGFFCKDDRYRERTEKSDKGFEVA